MAAVVEAKPTFVESSADGAVTIELDADGALLRCQIEPVVTSASWTADVLADRVMRLHRLALMRARCAQRIAMNGLVEPSGAYPIQSEVDEYRRSLDF